MEMFGPWLSANFVAVAGIAGGLWAAFTWIHEQAKQRAERREKRYWELMETAIGGDGKPIVFVARQIAALNFLITYREYRATTKAIFENALSEPDSPWTNRYGATVRALLQKLS